MLSEQDRARNTTVDDHPLDPGSQGVGSQSSIDLGDIRAFVEAVHSTTFTAAAAALGLTQSALSRRIARFEAAIGEVVFDRSNRRSPRLAPHGRAILPHAEELLAEYERFVSVTTRSAGFCAVKMVISDFSAGYVLPELRLHMLGELDGSHLSVMVRHPGYGICQALEQGEAELGLLDSASLTPNLQAVSFGRVHNYAVGVPSYLGESAEPIDWSELEGLPLLLPSHRQTRITRRRINSNSGEVLNVVDEPNTLGCLLALVRAGMGVAILPGYEHVSGLTVRPINLDGLVHDTSIVLAWRGEVPLSSAAASLVRDLQSRQHEPPLLHVPDPGH